MRCDAALQWPDHPRCENTARIKIKGHVYCHMHASIVAFSLIKNIAEPTESRCECTARQPLSWHGEKKTREAEGWRCKRRAFMLIDGVNMCQAHARLIILQHAIKDGVATVLPYDGPYKPLCFI